jgi:NAD-reducing hydrogenase large subunit
LIEILHCAEAIKELLHDDDLFGNDLVRTGIQRMKGIGIIEAPRGTLTHRYDVDENGMITRCNLIVSTTNNNEAMNAAVRWVANNVIDRKGTVTDGMLNQVEVAIRAYDPCLSCATHAMGKMPLKIELYNHLGELSYERTKN